jgi:hypothetical protein
MSSVSKNPADWKFLTKYILELFQQYENPNIVGVNTFEQAYVNPDFNMVKLTELEKEKIRKEFEELLKRIDINTCDPEYSDVNILLWMLFEAIDFGVLRHYFFTEMFLFVVELLILNGVDISVSSYNPKYTEYSENDKTQNTKTALEFLKDQLNKMIESLAENKYGPLTNYLYDSLSYIENEDNDARLPSDKEGNAGVAECESEDENHKEGKSGVTECESEDETDKYLEKHQELCAMYIYMCIKLLLRQKLHKVKLEEVTDIFVLKQAEDIIESDLAILRLKISDLTTSFPVYKCIEPDLSFLGKRKRELSELD